MCECIPYECCWYKPKHRHFLTKKEEIEMLKKYKQQLQEEMEGVEERIKELQ